MIYQELDNLLYQGQNRRYPAYIFWRLLKLELTDELIEGAIDSISGFIVAKAAAEYHKPLDAMMETFLSSNTYNLLSDKGTGLYWDNLLETYSMFIKEIGQPGTQYYHRTISFVSKKIPRNAPALYLPKI
ncbi:MAG: hypothetical protein LBT39_03000 [Treponema sp.]|jgi:hypothetical protein|nr:hypothetical protein [Treponema sp.]